MSLDPIIIDAKKEEEGYKEFQSRFPREMIKNMSLEQYAFGEDSFQYYVGFQSAGGNVQSGNASKFGIWKYSDKAKLENWQHDEIYAWKKSIKASNSNDVYEFVHKQILNLIDCARNGDFSKVDKCNVLGESVRWKVAYLYSSNDSSVNTPRLLPIYQKEAWEYFAKNKGLLGTQRSERQAELLNLKPVNLSIFESRILIVK